MIETIWVICYFLLVILLIIAVMYIIYAVMRWVILQRIQSALKIDNSQMIKLEYEDGKKWLSAKQRKLFELVIKEKTNGKRQVRS